MRGGTFVPRIDVLTEDGENFFYKRYRRDEGTYELCASKVRSDIRYKEFGWWSNNEIKLASEGTPSGNSPSFWISVRMDYYINMKLGLRNADD